MKFSVVCVLGLVLALVQSSESQGAKRKRWRAPPARLVVRSAPVRRVARDVEELPLPPPADVIDDPDAPLVIDELPVVEEPIRPMTVAEFASAFRPAEGEYRVLLVHPFTCQPVEVCFRLPCGRLEEFNVRRRELEFEYDDFEVEIRFKRNGQVRVVYDD